MPQKQIWVVDVFWGALEQHATCDVPAIHVADACDGQWHAAGDTLTAFGASAKFAPLPILVFRPSLNTDYQYVLSTQTTGQMESKLYWKALELVQTHSTPPLYCLPPYGGS